jgi:hypothetical protein
LAIEGVANPAGAVNGRMPRRSASTANAVSADALIVVVAPTVSSVPREVDDAAKRDSSTGRRADGFPAGV